MSSQLLKAGTSDALTLFRHAKPCAAAGEPGADVPGADRGDRGPDDCRRRGQRSRDELYGALG